MFYEPLKNNHGLPKNPFNSLIVPRPIGWISSIDSAGIVNLAPYSFFNAVCYKPPTVMFSSGPGNGNDGMKDSLRNIEDTSYKKEISKQYTIAPAYNKGAYQVINPENIKDIGR